MSFNPLPQNYDEKLAESKAHAQRMLDIIRGLSNFDVEPLDKFNYGKQTNQANLNTNALQQANYINYLTDPGYGALLRRMGP